MKFSIITPAHEVAHWLPFTIESVLSQKGDFDLEYIIVADASSDATVAIAKEYQRKIAAKEYPIRCLGIEMRVLERSEAKGMYVAINEGFAKATGDIYAWIAGDDVYKQGAFEVMAKAFAQRSDIVWIKGQTSIIDGSGKEIIQGSTRVYRQDWLRLGVYGAEAYHVEQDSNFWRKELWQKAGPFPEYFKSSGDYWLWIQFAKYAPLWTIDTPISSFRKREGQDSRANADRLLKQKLQARNGRPLAAWIPRLFFWPYYHVSRSTQKLLDPLYPLLFPFHKRIYLKLEENTLVERSMRTFYLC